MNESLEQFCKELHIENTTDYHELTIYNEIKQSVKEIPKYMSDITELLNDKKLIEACEYYAKFINYIEGIKDDENENESDNNNENRKKKSEELLSSIYHFITLPKDFSCIQIPTNNNITLTLNNNNDDNNEEISWDIDIEATPVEETNTGNENNESNNNDDNGEINWDLDDDDLLGNSNNNNNGVSDVSNNSNNNDEWNIKVEESGDISVEACGTVLLNQDSRGKIIQNLSELNSFYKQRKNEINNISVSLMSTQLFPSIYIYYIILLINYCYYVI